MKNKISRAVIIGLDSLQGLQTSRVLAKRKVPVIGIAKDPHYHSCHTKVCEKIIFTNTENEQLIETLIDLGPKLNRKAVLYPCQDLNVLILSKYRDELKDWYHIALPTHEVLEMTLNKAKFYEFLMEHQLPLTCTHILKNRRQAENISSELNYPVIIKPPIRSSAWLEKTSLKAFKVLTPDQFLSTYDKYHTLADVLIAQEWIKGPDQNHFTSFCYFNKESKPLVTFISRKLRQWPLQTGQRCLGEEVRNDFVLNTTIQLFKSVKFYGFGYLEMKRDQNSGNYYIIEANVGRPTGPSTMAEAAGVELHYTMYCDCLGLSLPANLKQQYVGVKWIHLLRDIQSVYNLWRKKEITLKGWLNSLHGKKKFAIFSWEDPLPFINVLAKALCMLFFSPKKRKIYLQSSD